jgi:hypothetical protein
MALNPRLNRNSFPIRQKEFHLVRMNISDEIKYLAGGKEFLQPFRSANACEFLQHPWERIAEEETILVAHAQCLRTYRRYQKI